MPSVRIYNENGHHNERKKHEMRGYVQTLLVVIHSHTQMSKNTVELMCFGFTSHQKTKTAIRVSYGACGSSCDIHQRPARLPMM